VDLTAGVADVVVTDGFTGNVALKLMEGTSSVLVGAIRDVATSTARAKAGGLLLRPALRSIRDELDPEAAGGALLLGLRGVGVIHHGRFTRAGIAQAIAVAERAVQEQAIKRTHDALEAAGALRKAPSEQAASVPTAP
jgi:glycerol-3-phosphate acyltransferase PlsX